MEQDTELDAWREEWHSHDILPAGAKQRVDREILMWRIGHAAAIAVTVMYTVGSIVWLSVSPDGDPVVAGAIWVFVALTWGVSSWLNSGPTKLVAGTTSLFVEFMILNCQRYRRGIAAGAVLYVGFLALMVAWRYHQRAGETSVDLGAYLLSTRTLTLYVISVVLGACAFWWHGRLTRELQRLQRIRVEMESAG